MFLVINQLLLTLGMHSIMADAISRGFYHPSLFGICTALTVRLPHSIVPNPIEHSAMLATKPLAAENEAAFSRVASP